MNTRSFCMTALAVAMTAAPGRTAGAASLLIEAESFPEKGGWVVDSQFMDRMGSPYLLAHGLGRPVTDAKYTANFPTAGTYRVFVRTKDWVAPWKAPGYPGRFQVMVNSQALEPVFGTEGADWHWQYGGTVRIDRLKGCWVELIDLTGFEGRCDAIYFTTDPDFTPPNRDPEMAEFRRRELGWPASPEPAGSFDLVVAGGGIAGTCAAISAARLGLTVALVQDRPVLGGNNSSEVRVWLQGARNKEPWPRVGDVVAELEQARSAHYGPENTAEIYEDERKLALARAETNLTLFLEHRVNAAEARAGRIEAVVAQETLTGRRVRIAGRWFADCTGDAALGALAGADFEVTSQGHMGPCNLWNVADTGAPAPFPSCPWALDLSRQPFPGRHPTKPDTHKLGGWYWESGFDLDPVTDIELVRDWNFRAMYGAWDAMKNTDGVLPNYRLNWSAHILGKRESRRLMGDVVLTLADLKEARAFPDGCVPTGWKVDLHLPDPAYDKAFQGQAFISTAHFTSYPMPFWVPYRCLYSRNVPNLFMAGRDISVSHEALGAIRVMRTGGCMGEIVGMAASLCKAHGADPRGVYEQHLPELQDLMRRGVGRVPARAQEASDGGAAVRAPPPPEWLPRAGTNLARAARVTVSGSRDAAAAPPTLLNDGRADLADNSGRWLSEARSPAWVEFAWDAPQEIGAVRVISGYRRPNGSVDAAMPGMELQRDEAGAWRAIPGAAVSGNTAVDWSARFDAVRASRVRLQVAGAEGGIARIWEVELYPPVR